MDFYYLSPNGFEKYIYASIVPGFINIRDTENAFCFTKYTPVVIKSNMYFSRTRGIVY